jgi:hypothetical protein
MEFLVSWLQEAEFSELTIKIAEILVPILVAYLLAMVAQGSRWLSAQLKANMTAAQLKVLATIADIAVAAAKQWLEENSIPLPWEDEPRPDSVTKFNERAVQEFEALRQAKGLPMVDTLTTRALVSHSVEKTRNLPVIEVATLQDVS